MCAGRLSFAPSRAALPLDYCGTKKVAYLFSSPTIWFQLESTSRDQRWGRGVADSLNCVQANLIYSRPYILKNHHTVLETPSSDFFRPRGGNSIPLLLAPGYSTEPSFPVPCLSGSVFKGPILRISSLSCWTLVEKSTLGGKRMRKQECIFIFSSECITKLWKIHEKLMKVLPGVRRKGQWELGQLKEDRGVEMFHSISFYIVVF